MRLFILSVTHLVILGAGFVLGIYLLPILTAPPGPDKNVLAEMTRSASFQAEFTRDLKGSDFLHWGEGRVSLSDTQIAHEGTLAPGPDYKLYLTAEFVEDEAGFLRVKQDAIQIGDIKSFDGFLVTVPEGVEVGDYTAIVVWCEAFGQFITAARYR